MSVRRGSAKRAGEARGRTAEQRRFAPPWWAIGFAAASVLVVAAFLASFALRPYGAQGEGASPGLGGLPGPLGGPEVAQDVDTLVGTRASGFTLPDSEGTSYAVTPGTGKPVVLVFHMGIT